MIKEQNLKFINREEILKQILSSGKYLNKVDNIEINFYEDKAILERKEDDSNNNNNYFVGKYKNIYIGCLSFHDLCHRDKFGLNKYSKDNFYVGQWKYNLKEGIGFLKVKNEILYLGEFSQNQFNGFGILNFSKNNVINIGNFNNGEMESGIFYNNKCTVFYHGKFKEGKKNDKLCSYLDLKNNHIFIGEVKDDIFIKGYLSICKITEEKSNEELQTNISIEKVIYFDKTNPKKPQYECFYTFEQEFYDNIQNIFLSIFGGYFDLKNIHDNYIAFLGNMENVAYSDSYNEYLERYNPKEKFNLENNFVKNYEIYHKKFTQIAKKLNLEAYETTINSKPIIHPDLINLQIK